MASESGLASLSMMKNPCQNLVIVPTGQHKKVVIHNLIIGG
jgi:hypothetical protein